MNILEMAMAAKMGGGKGGRVGVSSWNDLTDKPFKKQGGDTLTWEAATEADLDPSLLAGDYFYPFSNAKVTMDDLAQGGAIKMAAEGIDAAFSATDCVELGEGAILVAEALFAISKDNVTIEDGGVVTVFPKAGVYCLAYLLFSDVSFTINGYTGFGTEQIDPKVLPKALRFGETTVPSDTLTWDGNTEGLVSVDEYGLYKISDATPTFTDLNKGGVLHFKGEAMPMPWNEGELANEDVVTPQGVVMMSTLYIVPAEMAGVMDEALEMTFPEAGMYVPPVGFAIQLNGYNGFTKTEIKTIEPEYLPGAVVLYTDGTYLYSDSDVTDATKRITKAQLMGLLPMRNEIVIDPSPVIGDALRLFPMAFNLIDGFSGIVALDFMASDIASKTYYTAEYTAE